VKGYIDTAITYRRVCQLGFHKLVSGTPASSEFSADMFKALIDYIKEMRIPFLTIEDLYAARDGPIQVAL
jgi:hypothetical protein